tara:strand:+ start:3750 stop:5045 length:1296 start_codon:yes stop_codon:yes gene_type:complete
MRIKKLKFIFNQIFQSFPSLAGKSFDKNLLILKKFIPFKILKYRSGSKCLDWIIPNSWSCNFGHIKINGKKIIDSDKNKLHVVSHSIPIKKYVIGKELKKHLFFLKKLPSAIPYVTSYYKKFWGFCISYKDFKKIRNDKFYYVNIDSKLEKDYLKIGHLLIKGKSKKEILLSTYLCHTGTANHEIGGPLVMLDLYEKIKKIKLNYSIRFLILPENIGSAAYLSTHGEYLKKNLIAGYIMHFLGKGKEFNLKKSKNENSLTNHGTHEFLKLKKKKFSIQDFFADGSDERQFCSPYYNLPVACLSRMTYPKFKYYHSSFDNIKRIDFKTLKESSNFYYELIKYLDKAKFYKSLVQKGTTFFTKRKLEIYPTTMQWNSKKAKDTALQNILNILSYMDGVTSDVVIRNKLMINKKDFSIYINYLLRKKLIKILVN